MSKYTPDTNAALDILDARIAETNQEIDSVIRRIRECTMDLGQEWGAPAIFPSTHHSRLSQLTLEFHTHRAVRAALRGAWAHIAKAAEAQARDAL